MTEPGVTWKEYVDTRFDAQDKANGIALAAADRATTAALAAQEMATSKAEEAQEKRNEGFNNFRSLSNDRDKNFATKESVDNLAEKVNTLVNQLSASAGKSQGSAGALTNLNTWLILAIGIAAIAVQVWSKQ